MFHVKRAGWAAAPARNESKCSGGSTQRESGSCVGWADLADFPLHRALARRRAAERVGIGRSRVRHAPTWQGIAYSRLRAGCEHAADVASRGGRIERVRRVSASVSVSATVPFPISLGV